MLSAIPRLAGRTGIQPRNGGEIPPHTGTLFPDSGSGPRPVKEAVAAWRDELVHQGYAATGVNATPTAVNGHQEFCGDPPAIRFPESLQTEQRSRSLLME